MTPEQVAYLKTVVPVVSDVLEFKDVRAPGNQYTHPFRHYSWVSAGNSSLLVVFAGRDPSFDELAVVREVCHRLGRP